MYCRRRPRFSLFWFLGLFFVRTGGVGLRIQTRAVLFLGVFDAKAKEREASAASYHTTHTREFSPRKTQRGSAKTAKRPNKGNGVRTGQRQALSKKEEGGSENTSACERCHSLLACSLPNTSMKRRGEAKPNPHNNKEKQERHHPPKPASIKRTWYEYGKQQFQYCH